MNVFSLAGALLPILLCLAGCGGGLPLIPESAPVARTAPDAAAIFAACLQAHGGKAAYARLHDVNVRFDSHWAAIGPALQPELSDRGYRQGSEERYVPVPGGFAVGQHHSGPSGVKHVVRIPPGQARVREVQVCYDRIIITCYLDLDNRPPVGAPPADTQSPAESRAAAPAGLVADAYAMFLWGPYFFTQRAAVFQKLGAAGVVDDQPCDELLTDLRPGLGVTPEDRVVLYIGQQDHLLHRVQFTINAVPGAGGAEVHVDLMGQRPLAGVMWPTRFRERIDHPLNLPAHRWQLLGFDVNRGYPVDDLYGPRLQGRAEVLEFGHRANAPAAPLPAASPTPL